MCVLCCVACAVSQASNQTMKHSGGSSFQCGCYLHMFMYLYNALLYVFGMLKHKKRHKISLVITYCTLYNCTEHEHCAHTYVFENELLLTTAVQQSHHMDMMGCHIFFSKLISIFIFDILQIHSGCITPTCTPYLPTCNEQTQSRIFTNIDYPDRGRRLFDTACSSLLHSEEYCQRVLGSFFLYEVIL